MLNQPDPVLLRDRRVLMVKDDYFIAEDLCRGLEEEGADVLGPVASLRASWALLGRSARPDLALLDVKLGDETVYPLADTLQELGVPSSSPRLPGNATCPRLTPRCPAARSRSI